MICMQCIWYTTGHFVLKLALKWGSGRRVTSAGVCLDDSCFNFLFITNKIDLQIFYFYYTSIIMANSPKKTGLKRESTTDQYYTHPHVVDTCINLICEHVNIDYERDVIIEPSAGNGAFVDSISNLCKNTAFYDIDPKHETVMKQDYLDFKFGECPFQNTKIHVIGNPPFGRQSKLAIKFIKHSALFCHTIGFILPKSFKKESMKKHFPREFHNICEIDLPIENAFIIDNQPHSVPCVFQIWEKRETMRDIPVKHEPLHYRFVKIDDNPDISFRRVGVYAGAVDLNYETKSTQSHYFIKFDNLIVDHNTKKKTLVDQLNSIVYNCKDHTVGPRSISKQELICEFNIVIVKFIQDQNIPQ